MKNVLTQSWQSTVESSVENTPSLAVVQRSVMPTGASASVRTRAFDATAVAGIAARAAAKRFAAVVTCASANPCAHAAVAAHRGPHAWRPPVC